MHTDVLHLCCRKIQEFGLKKERKNLILQNLYFCLTGYSIFYFTEKLLTTQIEIHSFLPQSVFSKQRCIYTYKFLKVANVCSWGCG